MRFPLASSVSLVASVVILVFSILDGDAVTGCLSGALLIVSMILILESRRFVVPDIMPFVAAAACVLGSYLLMEVLNWTPGCGIEENLYSHIEGLVAWGMTFPLAYLALAAVVNLTGAVFNRVTVAGFTAFFSVGLMTLTWVFISVFCYSDLDVRYVSSQEMSYLFVNLVASAVAAVVITKALKGKHYSMSRKGVSE